MNNRLLLLKSAIVFVCCVFLAVDVSAQSGNNQEETIEIDATNQQANDDGQQTLNDAPKLIDNLNIGEEGSSGGDFIIDGGVITDDDPGITNPPASYYEALESRKVKLENDLQSLDPSSSEYANLNRKLEAIKEELENK